MELNCPLSLLNPATTKNKRETKHYFDVVKPAVVVVPDRNVAANLVENVSDAINLANLLLVIDGPVDSPWQSFGTSFDQKPFEEEAMYLSKTPRNMDDTIVIFFTSGTTSLPKGCPHTNTSLTAMGLGYSETMDIGTSNSSCLHLVLFHIYSFNLSIPYHINGAKVVHPSAQYDAGTVLAAIEKEKLTDLAAVPAMIVSLITHPEFKKADLSSLKDIIMSGTTITPENHRMCKEDLKGERIFEGFGMTETGVAWRGPPDQVAKDKYPM